MANDRHTMFYMGKEYPNVAMGGDSGGGSVEVTHYKVYGNIIDSNSTGFLAYGTADITIIGNFARIDFEVLSHNNNRSSSFYWGLNPALLTQLDSNIPTITPTAKMGSWDVFGFNFDRMNYGTTFDISYGRWRPVRYYIPYDDEYTGAWTEADMYFPYRGTCYGTIE